MEEGSTGSPMDVDSDTVESVDGTGGSRTPRLPLPRSLGVLPPRSRSVSSEVALPRRRSLGILPLGVLPRSLGVLPEASRTGSAAPGLVAAQGSTLWEGNSSLRPLDVEAVAASVRKTLASGRHERAPIVFEPH